VIIVNVLLAVAAAYLTAYVAYQTLLFAANAWLPDPPAVAPTRSRHFTLLIPAHNEELYLPRLLESLKRQRYSETDRRIVVIADNCSDGTAAACRPFPAEVFERHDATQRGKGHAIGWAVSRLDLAKTDAIVIVDADSVVDERFLEALNAQLERGDRVVQCYNGVANPGQSWFTRLMDVSRTIANDILHPGKRKLGLSSHLMGNGMCFTSAVIGARGWNAFSVGEDWEYYVQLILQGIVIGYCRDARVYHQESSGFRQASSQRLRWAGSRFQMLRRYGLPLIARGVATRNVVCADASMPLVLPNPSLAVNLTVAAFVAALVPWIWGGDYRLALWFGALTAAQLVMFLIGARYTRAPLASALSLIIAPAFLIWKLGIDILSFGGVGTKQWKATTRNAS
jgi:cellulose synthase/poly-beta-1,6-N-acetylglucosamine synthase-like glycosyltransferase